MPLESRRAFSGAIWEKQVGYCRALRRGGLVAVSGTTSVAEGGGVHAPGDAYRQAQRCFQIALAALRDLGGSPADVVRARMFVTDISRWAEFGRAHQEALGQFPPASSMVEVKGLIDPALLIELELDAVVE